MQEKTAILTLFLTALIALSSIAAPFAFIYPDGSEDDSFEVFGPRIDKIVIKKYASLDAELAALQNGEIDITDMGLSQTWIDTFGSDPNVTMLASGMGPAGNPGTGYYTVNFNNNDNEYLGNPEDPMYLNPVYPNPASIPEFRQACSHLVDRIALCSGQSEGFYEPIFTPIPAFASYWIHPNISYTGSLSALAYPPSVVDAAAKLDGGGFPLTGSLDGYRYWDRDSDLEQDIGEEFTIKLYTRSDALRNDTADMLIAGFEDPAIKIHYTAIPGGGGVAWQKAMVEKDYHIYTSGWIYIGPDPDYLYELYHWDNYYHPEDPPNYGAISKDDLVMQEYLEEAKFAATSEDALAAVLAFQERFAEFACECPLASSSSLKAFSKVYTGGNDAVLVGNAEDAYRGHAWTQVVNEAGQGENSAYTTLNAYPEGFQYGDGNMIMRYGWSDNIMPKTLNPLTYSWYWEGEVIDRIYEHLFSRNPATKGPSNSYSVLQNWTLGTWTDPRDGLNYSKITVVIRPGIFWSDGVPLTIEDVIYSVEEMPTQIFSRFAQWWDQDYVEGFRKLDEYSAEFLMNVNTYSAPVFIDRSTYSSLLVPKRVWQPFIATHAVAEFMGDLSGHPELLVGTGPFVFVENTADTLTLVRNPYFHQRMSTSVLSFDEQGYRNGVTITALAPSTQITPFKIQVDSNSLGHASITVPVENLDVDDACFIRERIELVYPNTTVVVLKDEASVNIQAAQMLLDNFGPFDFDRGGYTVKVTVEIVDGPLYEWVNASLPSELWSPILGPVTVEQCFWVTTRADINSDFVVDIFDIAIVATVFGSTIGSENFNGIADLNGDYVIDIFDIVQVAVVFSWPG